MRSLLVLALAGLMTAGAALAHHSLAAEFDSAKPVTITGTFTSIDWRNPHGWLYVDVKDAAGKVVKWQVELGSPNQMARSGWNKDSVKAGEELVIAGIMAKDGTNTVSSRNIKFKDGRTVFSQGGR
jgi:Family of unknown function (DUF6152)